MPDIISTPDPKRQEKLKAFDRLLTIMDELRENCPWDKKQTISSLRYLTIEEVYELSDAIVEEDMPEIKKEIGDILLHLVFYARIASEQQAFDIADVINALCEKMIRRHPHIYGDTTVSGEEDVKKNWEQIKLAESKNKRVLEGVPNSMPSLVKAMRIQEKAKGVGFDWSKKEDAWKKVEEELKEFNQAKSTEQQKEEFGDLLFALVNYSRFIDVNAEDALENTNKKFIRRFNYVEEQTLASGKTLKDMSLEEMDAFWDDAKRLERERE